MRVIFFSVFMLSACVHLENLVSSNEINVTDLAYCTRHLAEGEFIFTNRQASDICQCMLSSDQAEVSDACLENFLKAADRSEEFDEKLGFHSNCTMNFSETFQSSEQVFVFCSCVGAEIFADQVKGRTASGLPIIVALDKDTIDYCQARVTVAANPNIAH